MKHKILKAVKILRELLIAQSVSDQQLLSTFLNRSKDWRAVKWHVIYVLAHSLEKKKKNWQKNLNSIPKRGSKEGFYS